MINNAIIFSKEFCSRKALRYQDDMKNAGRLWKEICLYKNNIELII